MTATEIQIMRKFFPVRSNDEMLGMLGCSMSTMYRYAQKLGLKRSKEFTRQRLQVTGMMLGSWARRNLTGKRLKPDAEYRVTSAMADIIRERYPDTDTRVLAEELGLPLGTMKKWVTRNGVHKSPEYIHAIKVKAWCAKTRKGGVAIRTNKYKDMDEKQLLEKMFEVMQGVLHCDIDNLKNSPRVTGGRQFPLPCARGVVFEQFRTETGWTLRKMQSEFGYDRNAICHAIKQQESLRTIGDTAIVNLYNNFHTAWEE